MRILVLVLKIESIFCCIMYSYCSQLTLRLYGSTKTQFTTGGFNAKNQLVLNHLLGRIWQVELAHEIVLSSGKKFSLTQVLFYSRNIEDNAPSLSYWSLLYSRDKFSYLGHTQPVSETVSYYL